MKIQLTLILILFTFWVRGQQYNSKVFETDELKFIVTADCKIKPFEGQFVKGDSSTCMIEELSFSFVASDPAGNIRLAFGHDYMDTSLMYKPGFSIGDYQVYFSDRVHAVSGDDIRRHIADYADNGVIDEPIESIFSWPGKGNRFYKDYDEGIDLTQYAESYEDFAPFYEGFGNDIYEPDKGEYPMYDLGVWYGQQALPEQIFWTSVVSPWHSQLSLTTYSFKCNEGSLVDNTFYTHYEWKVLGVEDLQCNAISTRAELSSDSAYLSTTPDADAYFLMDSKTKNFSAYMHYVAKGDIFLLEEDRSCNQESLQIGFENDFDGVVATYGPERTAQHLGASSSIFDYYIMLSQGLWNDGTPITSDAIGYNTDSTDSTYFMFQGDLRDTSDWNEYSVDVDSARKKEIYSVVYTPIMQAQGVSREYTTAHSFLSESSRELIYDEWQHMQDLNYDNIFHSVWWRDPDYCPDAITSTAGTMTRQRFQVYPNPAIDMVKLESETELLTVLDASGKTVISLQHVTEVDLSMLPVGLYFLHMQTGANVHVQKLVKI